MSKIVYENKKPLFRQAVTKIECVADEDRLNYECPIKMTIGTGDEAEEKSVPLRELVAMYARVMTGGADRNRCEYIWDELIAGETRVNFSKEDGSVILTGLIVRKYTENGRKLTVRMDDGSEHDIYACAAWLAV